MKIILGSIMTKLLFVKYFIILYLFSFASFATPHPKEVEADLIIDQLYAYLKKVSHNNSNKQSMSTRLDLISEFFMGKKYLLGALGEGINARFDQQPRYRTDLFDCETYVTTVLALAFADKTDEFKICLKKIRYFEGQVAFTKRNHFTELDWNYNNYKQGFIKDFTSAIKDQNNKSVSQIASTVIDKPSWYDKFTTSNIRIEASNKEKLKRLAELKNKGKHLAKIKTNTPYIPFSALFFKTDKPNLYLFSQIPNGSIIEIIRPNWNLQNKIGTNLNISHLGFAFWRHGTLLFREASSIYGKVVDIPLIQYLDSARNNATIKGINIQVVLPKKNCATVFTEAPKR